MNIRVCGNRMAHWRGSTMPCSWMFASWPGKRPDRAPQSSAARASKARKRGARIDPSGHDAGKKVKGKKRHIVVDTLGMMLEAQIQPADIQDRDGASPVLKLPVLKGVRRLFPFIERIFADGGYQGAATAAAVRELGVWHLEIVKRSDTAKGFQVLPKRWIVERTFGWLGRCRRLAKDFENLSRMALAFLRLAMIRIMMRRIARIRKS